MANLSFVQAGKLSELLSAADPKNKMYVRILTSNRLALGIDPLAPTLMIDFSNEKVLPYVQQEDSMPIQAGGSGSKVSVETGIYKTTRRSGQYWFELKEKRVETHSLRDLLAEALRALEAKYPGTLEKLSQFKGRSRRIVARDPKLLFDKAHLTANHAEKLIDGWYFGTNNSADSTNSWLRRACAFAGVEWGKEFRSNLDPTLDDLV